MTLARRSAAMVLLVVAVLGGAPSRVAGQAAPDWRVGLLAYGPIRYGMTLRAAGAVLGEPLRVADAECDHVSPRAVPRGVVLMVIRGRVERVEVSVGGVTTLSGIGVGSTEEDVHRAYPGRIRTRTHEYTGPEGHYLIFEPRDAADSAFGLIFETDGARVTSYRAGRRPAVGYVEGCS